MTHEQMIAWLTLEGWEPTADAEAYFQGAVRGEERLYLSLGCWGYEPRGNRNYATTSWGEINPGLVCSFFTEISRGYA